MKQQKRRGARTFTGVAGEHYVAAELWRRGAIATVTSKNTPDFDIMASSADGFPAIVIQVKALRSDSYGFPLGTMHQYPENSFHVFVLIKGEEVPPRYWIIPSNEVIGVAKTENENWLKGRSEKSASAPVTLQWKHLKVKGIFENHLNRWDLLGIIPKQVAAG